jgi:hypothetical protein
VKESIDGLRSIVAFGGLGLDQIGGFAGLLTDPLLASPFGPSSTLGTLSTADGKGFAGVTGFDWEGFEVSAGSAEGGFGGSTSLVEGGFAVSTGLVGGGLDVSTGLVVTGTNGLRG